MELGSSQRSLSDLEEGEISEQVRIPVVSIKSEKESGEGRNRQGVGRC